MKFNLLVGSRHKAFLTILFVVISLGLVQAQTTTVTGNVTGEGQPLPGVSILVKGTATGTVTDFDGNFEIKTDSKGVLIFTYIGFIAQEVPVNGQTKMDVTMTTDVATLDEVVVIGYGKQKKRELTGAVGQVQAEAIERISTSDVGNALQGQIAGVNVTSSSGQPGSDAVILIRGVNSVFGSNTPLYVVDGIPQDGNPQLSVAEIETIDVLKDAASAAIYGTRGSAGVILITTKTGKVGKMNISVTSYMGVQDITSSVPLMNFEESLYENFLRVGHLNGTFPNNSFTTLEQNPNDFTNDTYLMDILQVDNARIQNHTMNVSGGKGGLMYNVSMNYFDQVGSLINSGLERLNVRANTTYKKDKWTITTGIGLRTDQQQYTPWGILLDGYRYKPYQKLIDPNSPTTEDSAGTNTSNDAVNLSYLTGKLKQSDIRTGDNMSMRVQIDHQLNKNLKLTTRASIGRNNNMRTTINPLFTAYATDGTLIPQQIRSGVKEQSSRNTSATIDGIITFNKKFGDHQVGLVGALSTEKYTFKSFFAQKFDLFNNEITTLNGATLDANVGTGSGWGQDRVNTLIGMLGRAQYDYKGKYLLSASLRRDGTSRFSEDNRWIYAPSASAAWIISDEYGWDDIFGKTFNFLKVRFSYGTTGNQSIQDYSTDPTISIGNDYVFGTGANEELVLGAIQESFKNPNAKWEKKIEKNFGLDFGFFNNKLTLTSEVYDGSRTNMLFPVILPPTVGGGNNSTVILNVGDMRNYGVEWSANYKHRGKLNWNLSANYAANNNLITRMSDSNKFSFLGGSQVAPGLPSEDLVTALREGYPAGAFFLVETNGLVKTEAELAEYRLLDPTANLGSLRYVDQPTVDTDNDGVADAGDGVFDLDDRVFKGSGAPDFEVGLNFNADYKSIDFSMNWYAAVGGNIINGSKAYAYKQGTHRDLVYQWSPANPTSNIPADRGRDNFNYRGYTDLWLQDGSFARLKNTTLGYTLPKKWSNKLNITKLRFYIAADNLITITSYDGFDPEVGNDGLNTRGIDQGTYPISTQYRAGVEFRF
ncbi:SusC/RagA family TonB-linked outer membrane protein [Algibacter lectus]|uniref:SusC/RagA family TonB-linked outer membrane protein n=1 Tax=Algibacter lectus TaxID=221126 RepID=UPI0026EC13EF|nr:TonB-dependent receptor [Algibacter lectus]MDO7135824.1 TonB-dependent receptor [Algibacter lectus]